MCLVCFRLVPGHRPAAAGPGRQHRGPELARRDSTQPDLGKNFGGLSRRRLSGGQRRPRGWWKRQHNLQVSLSHVSLRNSSTMSKLFKYERQGISPDLLFNLVKCILVGFLVRSSCSIGLASDCIKIKMQVFCPRVKQIGSLQVTCSLLFQVLLKGMGLQCSPAARNSWERKYVHSKIAKGDNHSQLGQESLLPQW